MNQPQPLPDGYAESDLQRFVAEGLKALSPPQTWGNTDRGAFARDRARVLHSSAFRHLAGKTQVVGPADSAVPRTRLTHSLEVAQIGREIAGQLGCDADLVDTAGLAHDIGHPPFGHNGERALDDAGQPAGGFEANAQNLRLLTRLEPKVEDHRGRSVGLNLTRASLDAVIKYPWERTAGVRKFGVYATEREVFDWVRAGEPGRPPSTRRCIEAQVMDWADDVAYSVHDVEDGVLAGRIDLRTLSDPAEQDVVAAAATGYSDQDVDALRQALIGLIGLRIVTEVIAAGDGPHRPAALKRLTSELTGRFATGPILLTREHHAGRLTRYAGDLHIPEDLAAEVAVLKAIAFRYVMIDPARLRVQEHEREVLIGLVDELARRGEDALEPALAAEYLAADDDAGRMRAVLDQVSLLTDAQAMSWHERLLGTR